MSASTETMVLGYAGAALLVLGAVAAATMSVLDPTSVVRTRYTEWETALDGYCRFLRLPQTGRSITRLTFIAITVIGAVALLIDEWILFFLLPPIVLAPYYSLKQRCEQRVLRIEAQLDTWLLMLANALKASPSLGEAIANSGKLMRPPMGEEIDLILKEMKLGTPLDQAVLNASARIGSPAVSSALATILVGRQTGGDLPKILEESAATLREMARLEGVVRTKTAEGKTQAYVLGVIPFVLIGAIHLVDENWLEPLVESALGIGIIGISMGLWIAAIVAARRILAVDV